MAKTSAGYNLKDKTELIRWMMIEHNNTIPQIAKKLGMSVNQVIKRALRNDED